MFQMQSQYALVENPCSEAVREDRGGWDDASFRDGADSHFLAGSFPGSGFFLPIFYGIL